MRTLPKTNEEPTKRKCLACSRSPSETCRFQNYDMCSRCYHVPDWRSGAYTPMYILDDKTKAPLEIFDACEWLRHMDEKSNRYEMWDSNGEITIYTSFVGRPLNPPVDRYGHATPETPQLFLTLIGLREGATLPAAARHLMRRDRKLFASTLDSAKKMHCEIWATVAVAAAESTQDKERKS